MLFQRQVTSQDLTLIERAQNLCAILEGQPGGTVTPRTISDFSGSMLTAWRAATSELERNQVLTRTSERLAPLLIEEPSGRPGDAPYRGRALWDRYLKLVGFDREGPGLSFPDHVGACMTGLLRGFERRSHEDLSGSSAVQSIVQDVAEIAIVGVWGVRKSSFNRQIEPNQHELSGDMRLVLKLAEHLARHSTLPDETVRRISDARRELKTICPTMG